MKTPLPSIIGSIMSADMKSRPDRKSTRLNSSHTEIYTLSLHDALPIYAQAQHGVVGRDVDQHEDAAAEHHRQHHERGHEVPARSEEHTSELQSHRDLHSFPTRRSSDLCPSPARGCWA